MTKPSLCGDLKSPLTKRTGDLQWRILHCAIAVNAIVSVMNPTICDTCPFCTERETIYHCFMECDRLCSLFCLLSLCNLVFSLG